MRKLTREEDVAEKVKSMKKLNKDKVLQIAAEHRVCVIELENLLSKERTHTASLHRQIDSTKKDLDAATKLCQRRAEALLFCGSKVATLTRQAIDMRESSARTEVTVSEEPDYRSMYNSLAGYIDAMIDASTLDS